MIWVWSFTIISPPVPFFGYLHFQTHPFLFNHLKCIFPEFQPVQVERQHHPPASESQPNVPGRVGNPGHCAFAISLEGVLCTTGGLRCSEDPRWAWLGDRTEPWGMNRHGHWLGEWWFTSGFGDSYGILWIYNDIYHILRQKPSVWSLVLEWCRVSSFSGFCSAVVTETEKFVTFKTRWPS